MQRVSMEHIYEYGDVIETIDTCDELEMQLSRLKRRRVLNEDEWRETKSGVETIRSQLEELIPQSSLQPKAPRLP